MKISIFTDGACSGNPGPGGWGALLVAQKNGKIISKKEIFGGEELTTNNRMELTAAIKGLHELTKPSDVTIVTDSKYLKDGMTKWLSQWVLNGWRNSAKKILKMLICGKRSILYQEYIEYHGVGLKDTITMRKMRERIF